MCLVTFDPTSTFADGNYWRGATASRDGVYVWLIFGAINVLYRGQVRSDNPSLRVIQYGAFRTAGANYILDSLTITPTRALLLNAAGTQIRSLTPQPSSFNFPTDTASEAITLTSGAGTGLTNPRLFTDDTYVWVSGVSSDRLTAYAYCYQISNGARVSSRDFSVTRTARLEYLAMNGSGRIYVFPESGTSAELFTFSTAVVPSGTVSNQTGTPGVAFSIDLDDDITGATSYSVRNTSLSGTGLSLSTTTGVLSGTPTSSHVGAHTIELRATSAAGNYDFSFTFTVTASLPTGTVSNQTADAGHAFSVDLSTLVTGTPDPTFSVRSSSLDGTGLSLSSAGVLSGTPTRLQFGTYTVQLRATNASGNYDFSFTLTVRKPPRVSTIPQQTHLVNTAFSFDVSSYVDVFPTMVPYALTRGQVNPAWASVSSAGVVSGTPTATGLFPIRLTVQFSTHFSMLVNVVSLPSGTVGNQTADAGSAFSLDLSSLVSGVPAVSSFTVRNNSLAGTGLSLSGTSPTGKTLSGTPTRLQSGAHTIQLRATNPTGNYDFSFTFTVRKSPVWSTVPAQTATTNSAFSLDVSSYIDASPTATVTLRSGQTNPSGLSVDGTTVKWTPTATGDFTVHLTATNTAGSAHTSFVISVGDGREWVNQANVTFASIQSGSFVVGGGTSTLIYARLGTALRQYLLNAEGSTATLQPIGTFAATTAFSAGGGAVSRDGQFLYWISNGSGTQNMFRYTIGTRLTSPVRFGSYVSSFARMETLTVTSNRIAMVNTARTGIEFFPLTASNNRAANIAGERITLVSGADPTGLSNVRLMTDDTHIWLTGTKSSGTEVVGYCYDISTKARVSFRDFSQTGLTAVRAVIMNANADFYLVRASGTSWERWTFEKSAAPTGTVSNQTGTPGVAFSLDLNDDITGAPDPTFTVRSSSLAGTGLSLSSAGVLSGTPTASHVGAHTIQLRATNTVGSTTNNYDFSFTWTVTASLPTGTVGNQSATAGASFSLDLSTLITGTPNPTFSVRSSSLAGTSLGLSDAGVLSGTVNRANSGTYTIQLRASNASGNLDFSFTFTVNKVSQWSSIPKQTHRVNTAFSLDVSSYVDSFPAATITLRSGQNNPSWASINASGVVSGTPTATGDVSIHLTASTPLGMVHTSFDVSVVSLASGTVPAQSGTPGVAFSLDLSTIITGAPDPTFTDRSSSLSGTGLALSSAGVLSGTPTSSHVGAHTLSLRATNPAGNYDFSFTWTVTRSTPTGTVTNQTANAGTAFSLDLSTLITGTPDPTFSVRNNSLTGTALALSGTANKTLSGTPSRLQSGAHTIELRASNASGDHDFSFTFTVRKPPVWSTVPMQSATVSAAFSLDMSTYLDAFPVVTAVTLTSGQTNPSGLTVSGTTISWTPSATGDYTVYLTASNGIGSAVNTSFTLRVVAGAVAPAGSVANQTAMQNIAYSLNLGTHITGTAPVTFTTRAALPSWLTLTGSTLSGTPTAAAAAVTIQLRASNSAGTHDFSFTLAVSATSAVTWQAIPNQSAYTSPTSSNRVTFSLDLADYVMGTPTPTITAKSSLPSWLSLTGTVLSGDTPTTGQAAVTLQFTGTNGLGGVDSPTFTLTVTQGSAPAFRAGQPSLPVAYIGRPYSGDAHRYFSGDPTPTFSAQYASGAANRPPFIALPTWLTFNDDGTFSGTPPAATYTSPYRLWLRVTGSNAYGSFTTFASFEIRTTLAPSVPNATVSLSFDIGEAFTIDLTELFDLGIPAGDLTLTRPPDWVTLTGTDLTGTYADTGQLSSEMETITVVATNPTGSATLTLQLTFELPDEARWITDALPDGGSGFPYRVDLSTLVSGTPTPTVAVTSGETLPAGLSLAGTILSVSALPTVGSDTSYDVKLTASNTVDSVLQTADTTLTLDVLVIANKPADYRFNNRLYLGWATLLPSLDRFARNRVVYHDVTVIRESVTPGTGSLASRTTGGIYVAAGFIHQSGIQNNEEAILWYNHDYTLLGRGSYHRVLITRNRYPFGITDDETSLYILVAQAISTDSELLQKVAAARVTSITSNPTGLFNTEADLCFFADGHLYVVNNSTGVCVAHNPDGTRDANLDFTLAGFTGPLISAICWDEYEQNLFVADDGAQLIRRYSLDGTQLSQTHAYTDIFPDFNFSTHQVGILGLGEDNGDVHAIAITMATGSARWNQYLGVLERTHPFWRPIPDQEVTAANSYRTSVDLNDLTHHDADIEIVPGSSLPRGATFTDGVFTYAPQPADRATAQTIYVQSSLRGERAFASFQVTGLSAPPVWSSIATQTGTAGSPISIDLASFIASGSPAPTFSFATTYTAPGWMRLTAGVISGTPPIPSFRTEMTLTVGVAAENTQGRVETTFSLRILPAPPGQRLPVWTTIPTQRATGGRPFSFDVADYTRATLTPQSRL